MKIIKKLCITFFFLVTFGITGLTQNSLRKGFIVNNSGDTINGYLLLQNSRDASRKCAFSSVENNDIKYYTPNDISGYRFLDGKYYVVKQIKDSSCIKNVFMEFLIKGKVNVYYLRDDFGDRYFVEKETFEIVELTEPVKTIYIDEKRYIKPLIYKGKLTSMLSDCSDINSEIKNTQLNHISLIKLANSYHEKVCETENCIIFERQAKTKKQYSLMLGYSVNQLNFGSKLISNYGNSLQIGFSIDFNNLILSNERLGLNLNFLIERDTKYTLKKFDKNDSYNEKITYYGKTYNINSNEGIFLVTKLDVNIDVIALKIPILFTYTYNLNKTDFYCGFGISNKFVLKQNNAFRYDEYYDTYGKSINSIFAGLAGSLGLKYKLNNSHSINFILMGDYLVDPRAVNKTLRLKIQQVSFRIGYSL